MFPGDQTRVGQAEVISGLVLRLQVGEVRCGDVFLCGNGFVFQVSLRLVISFSVLSDS
jgi:hypothetical protein